MSELQLQERWGFDEADLAANRQSRLTEKQRKVLEGEYTSQRSVFGGVGATIALVFCCLPVLIFGGRLLPSFVSNPQSLDLTNLAPTLVIPAVMIAAVVLVVAAVPVLYFLRARRKADIGVRKAEGIVNYVWETKRVRTPNSSVRNYEDVRVLILRIGPERRFEVNPQLQSIIPEGEMWTVYYTSYPFKFLSGERV